MRRTVLKPDNPYPFGSEDYEEFQARQTLTIDEGGQLIKEKVMPRKAAVQEPQVNPFDPEVEPDEFVRWNEDHDHEEDEAESNGSLPATHRGVRLNVSVEAINDAKSLATIAGGGYDYRTILADGATEYVAVKVGQLRRLMLPQEETAMPF